MSQFAPAIAVADLPPGQAAEVTVGGQVVALFNVNGTFHALAGRCPHRGGPLGQGFVDGPQVSCPWHNWTFDVTTGENVASADLKVARYEVRVEDGQVWVQSRMRNMTRSHFAPVVLVLASAAALVAQEAQKPAAPAARGRGGPGGRAPHVPGPGRAGHRGRGGHRQEGQRDSRAQAGGHHRHRGRRPPGGRLVRGGAAARPALRDAPSAAPGLGQHHARGAPGPHVRHPVRRHEHHALEGQPGEGGGGELPREGHPRGRPGDAHLDRRRHLVDGPNGVGPPEAPRHGEALRRPLHPRHVPGADVGLGGPAHPRLPRPAGRGARPAALRDLRRRIGPEPPAGQQPGARAAWRTPTSPGAPPRCTTRP